MSAGLGGKEGWHSGESTRLPSMWPGSIPGSGVIRGLSLLLVFVLALRVFLRVLNYYSLISHKLFRVVDQSTA